jgi:hypothetical protein
MKFLHSFRVKVCLITALLINILFLARYLHVEPTKLWTWNGKEIDFGAGNETLGVSTTSLRSAGLRSRAGLTIPTSQFAKILVVAPNEAPEQLHWRKDGLLKAAKYTGLDLEIPRQPVWTNADKEELKEKNKDMGTGYVLSWLGHLNALQIAVNQTTTLILEDDVDWDMRIRGQMPRIADAVRDLTDYKPPPVLKDSSTVSHSLTYPYGIEWDILWVGHCGDSIVFDPQPIILDDPTVPPYFNSWEKVIAPNPQHKRFIHWSAGPVCTYAYAVTSSAAKKILARQDHGHDAFDIWLHILCKGKALRCITVNPELFHHHAAAGVKDTLNDGARPEEGLNEKAFTDNIWHSARCNSVSEGDELVTCMGKKPTSKS